MEHSPVVFRFSSFYFMLYACYRKSMNYQQQLLQLHFKLMLLIMSLKWGYSAYYVCIFQFSSI